MRDLNETFAELSSVKSSTALWTRLSELFDAAVELPIEQRDAFVTSQCAGDIDLEQRLRRMLTADAQAQSRDFLESPALSAKLWDHGADDAAYEPGSRRFGPYRLIRLIGAGGMGEVHLAERSDGQFEQRVALKLLPHPTPGLMHRFRQERQILARLEHPNIARLLDGGVGEANIPYFAMEFVEGVPIDEFVAGRRLKLSAILGLFVAVCDAVQYAHRNLVVHRDIKPSNILVGADGTPKLLDFGIAKVLQSTDGDATQTRARAFTPDYAAPEQIRGESVTTATDVYSLGIVLYELLTGARPYTRHGTDRLPGHDILDAEARFPSVTAAKNRSPNGIGARALRGDLDTIVLNAIAKRPERRYATVEALANDIRRHLEGRPITARGESAWYRLRKFALRNRAGVLAVVVVSIALVTATVISTRQARIATEQAMRAEEKSKTAEAVKDYLLSVFASANPYNTDGKVVTARDLLEGGLDQVDRKLAGQPQVQAEIYAGFVETFMQLSNNILGKRAGEMALEKYRQFLAPDAIEILKVETNLAQADFYQTHFDGLIARFENLLARTGDRSGEYASVRADVLTLLGMTHYRMGHFEQSVQNSEAALTQLRKTKAKSYDYEIDIVLYNLYLARYGQGRLDDAAALISEFSTQDRLLVGPQHPGLFTDVTAVARLLEDIGRLHEAHDLYTAALAARRKQFPENHILVVNTRSYLADDDCELGDPSSEVAFDELLAFVGKPGIEIGATDLARIYVTRVQCMLRRNRIDRADDARQTLLSARELIQRVADKDSPFALVTEATLADVERVSGNAAAALTILTPIIAHQRERADRELPGSLLVAARANIAIGRFGEAQTALDEARNVLDRQGRPFCGIARDVELAWATLPASAVTRKSAAEHWSRVIRIGCLNFGCGDERVRQWVRTSAQIGGDAGSAAASSAMTSATSGAENKPDEAQYALALDILAKAKAAAAAASK